MYICIYTIKTPDGLVSVLFMRVSHQTDMQPRSYAPFISGDQGLLLVLDFLDQHSLSVFRLRKIALVSIGALI